MSKPDWCPQRVWDEAEKALRQANIKAHMLAEPTDPLECISRAILAAEQREREAIETIAAKGVKAPGADAWANGYRCAAADIEASIKLRGSEND